MFSPGASSFIKLEDQSIGDIQRYRQWNHWDIGRWRLGVAFLFAHVGLLVVSLVPVLAEGTDLNQ